MKKDIFISSISKYFTYSITTSFLLKEIQQKESSDKKVAYLKLLLQDATGTLQGIVWSENIKLEYEEFEGSIVNIEGIVTKNKKCEFQLIINRITILTEYQQEDYINGLSKEQTKKHMDLLWQYINSVKHEGYCNLLKQIFTKENQFSLLPATLKDHHNYNGGLLIYTLSTTIMAIYMAKTLQLHNVHPSPSIPYNTDILTTAGLLHSIGTLLLLAPFPNMRIIKSSISLNLHELTFKYLQRTLDTELGLTEDDENLLLHTIGCVYESVQRKPLTREAILLKTASNTHVRISSLEHYMFENHIKDGLIYDAALQNYIV